MQHRPAIFVLAALAAASCLPWAGISAGPPIQSVGTTSRGVLVGADHLDGEGRAHRSYKSLDRRFGSRELVGLVERASGRVAAMYPGTVTLIGDLSGPGGGFLSGHGSHRSGRDFDVAYFVTSPAGRHRHGWPLVRFDRFGIGVRADGKAVRLDAARNWALVEALVDDAQAEVQWIFASRGVKTVLLEWALDHGRDVELIRRALKVLHQPADAAPHDDHFHVRVYCPGGGAGAMCDDQGRRWEWLPEPAGGATPGDDALMRLALDGLDG